MTIETTLLSDEDAGKWRTYVAGHKDATFFHRLGWRDLTAANYPCLPLYLVAKEGGCLRGVLPLMKARNGFFGTKLTSLPYAVLGGICADSRAAENALVDHARSLAAENRCDYLELRQTREQEHGFTVNRDYVTFILGLENDADIHWRAFHNEIRRCIRRGNESGFTLAESSDIDTFYRIFCRAHRELGTPVISRRWIESIFAAYPDEHRILTAADSGRTIAAMMVREYRGTMDAVFGYVLREHRKQYPLHVMYWHLIQEACDKGLNCFNFGRSIRESGTYRFKQRWGAEPAQLYYHYAGNKNAPLDVSQKGDARGRVAAVWRRLPLFAANGLGPWLRRYYS